MLLYALAHMESEVVILFDTCRLCGMAWEHNLYFLNPFIHRQWASDKRITYELEITVHVVSSEYFNQ